MMKNINRWVWIAVFVIGIGITAWAVSYYSKATTAEQANFGGPPAMPVEAEPVKVRTIPIEVSTVGTLQANESVIIRSEIAGRIIAVRFSEGQWVEEGAALINIDPAEYMAQVEQITATVELNELNYQRTQQLMQEKLISQQAYDEIEAKLRESRANLDLVKTRLNKATIRAPFAGRVGLRQVSPGDYLQPGQAIVNLEDIRSIKVDFRVPDVYLSQIKTGQTVNIRVDALPDRLFAGKIYAIDPRIDEATRTILLRASIPNAGGELRPGMFVRVSIVLDQRPNAILIPEQALVPMGDAKLVYRVVDGKAALSKVKIGQRMEGQVEIVEGLGPNDTIVTGGQTKIFEGAPVMVVGPEAAKPELPAAAKP